MPQRAYDVTGAGITSALTEFIDDTRDANRARAPRLDLIVYMHDGSYWCLHHGDIKEIYADPVLQSVRR